ncbi:MAG: methylated-DNA--[protein]-cysteine S-methyltransferase [Nitrospiraceae bacterium]|nr:MAG: methylated-DNA--[protein]-cysteine S-methyltransferase [Nitrospiraceae bacterium]
MFDSPIGPLYLVFSGRLLSGVSFEKPVHIPHRKGSAPESFIKELRAYFSGASGAFKQGIKFLTGTDFEKKVWAVLSEIPFGETRSYKWVAEKTGNPAAVRAVGRALSKNPVPVVIPCHRVIESGGSIGGYSSGVEVKRRLLEMEYYAKGK